MELKTDEPNAEDVAQYLATWVAWNREANVPVQIRAAALFLLGMDGEPSWRVRFWQWLTRMEPKTCDTNR